MLCSFFDNNTRITKVCFIFMSEKEKHKKESVLLQYCFDFSINWEVIKLYKVLVADDEIKIRETVCDYLNAKGFDAVSAGDGLYAVEKAKYENYDLIILDVMMPNLDGLGACREIRKFSKVPILFLSALSEESDYLNGFKSGGDDYISKPFPMSVLCEKINSMIKRDKGMSDTNEISFSGVTVSADTRKVYIDSVEAELSDKDFRLLMYLMENKGLVISREKILDRIWGYDFDGDLRVVDTHIKILRKALKHKADLIKTVVNVGYRFGEV